MLASSFEGRENTQIRLVCLLRYRVVEFQKTNSPTGFVLTTLCRLASEAITLSWRNCMQKRTEPGGLEAEPSGAFIQSFKVESKDALSYLVSGLGLSGEYAAYRSS